MTDLRNFTKEELSAEIVKRDAEEQRRKDLLAKSFHEKLENFLRSTSSFKNFKLTNISEAYDAGWFKSNPRRRVLQIELEEIAK